MSIFRDQVVLDELVKLYKLVGTDDGRLVLTDINILTEALYNIDTYIFDLGHEHVIVECDMWERCHDALDNIVYYLGLRYDEQRSNYDYHQYAICR